MVLIIHKLKIILYLFCKNRPVVLIAFGKNQFYNPKNERHFENNMVQWCLNSSKLNIDF